MAETMLDEPEALVPSSQRSFGQWIKDRLLRRDTQRLLVNISIILIIGTFVQIQTGLFWTVRNWQAISVAIAVVTVCAVAMTLVMIAGHIDVSVPGNVVLGGIVAGLLIVDFNFPVWLAFIVAACVGGLIGVFNSFLVLGVGITSLIATIGTFYMAQGIANLLTNGLPIAGLPPEFMTLGGGRIWGVPYAVPMIALFVGVFVGIQRLTLLGRWVVATGSNPDAAFLNGVNVTRTTTAVFVLSGMAAGWGGVVYSSRLGNPSPQLDDALLFQVIVAIVIGGTSLFGGEGSVLGTFVGAVLIGVVNNGLNLMGISTFWQYIALGVLLIGSVGLDNVLRRDSFHRMRRNVKLKMFRPNTAKESIDAPPSGSAQSGAESGVGEPVGQTTGQEDSPLEPSSTGGE